jgi:uncharacterized protein (DUF1778 family)
VTEFAVLNERSRHLNSVDTLEKRIILQAALLKKKNVSSFKLEGVLKLIQNTIRTTNIGEFIMQAKK